MAQATTPPAQQAPYLTTLQRGLRVLEYIAASESGARSATEVAGALGASRGVTYHILRTLMADQYVLRVDRKYILGPQFGFLFDTFQDQLKPPEHVLEPLHRLRGQTGESCYVTGLVNENIAILYYLEGQGAIRVRRTAIGRSDNAHARAAARAILAYVPDQEIHRYIPSPPYPKLTPQTLTDPGQLKAALSRIRAAAISIEFEEYAPGVACMGAPVFNQKGEIYAAVGMSVVLDALKQRMPELAEAVHSAGEDASRQSGYKPNYPALDLEPYMEVSGALEEGSRR